MFIIHGLSFVKQTKLFTENYSWFISFCLNLFEFFFLQLILQAADSGSPSLSDTEILIVNVQRNLNDPVFRDLEYSITIDETQQVGSSILAVSATDSDTKVHIIMENCLNRNNKDKLFLG